MRNNKKNMRVLIVVGLVIFAMMSFACGKKDEMSEKVDSTREIFNLEENVNNRKIAVVYFSLNDDTKNVAETFAEALSTDILEIVPKVPYCEEDLDYSNVNSRIYLEDEFNPLLDETEDIDDEYETAYGIVLATISEIEKSRAITKLPEIENINVDNYQLIVLGFPVWYENAPKVVYTFVGKLKNKIIIPFCTGGEMGMIDQYLANTADTSVRIMSGKRFDGGVDQKALKDWFTFLSADFDVK
ncbi:MAG: hypothetical protein J6P02_03555 [Lachnospiraceae bacterium]|nr:hypothetical protein [Lachnospiraceae bacterium]